MKKSLSLIMALMLVVLSLFTFNIKTNIKAEELTDDQIIDIELKNIYVPSETIFSFPLVTDSAYNSDITWTSNNEAVIKIENGWAVVNRPTDSDVEVTLTVTITRGQTSKNNTFNVTVKKGETETNSYKINYSLNGGVNNVNNPTTYKVGETPKLLAPTNGTVEFIGWYLNDELIEQLPLGLSGDITLVAKWGSKIMTSIEVITEPTKLEYDAFEKFNPSGLVIRAWFNDEEHSYTDIVADETTEITYDKNILHGNDTKVTITYHGLTTTVDIKVNKIDYDLSNIKFEKIETTYDGLEHVALISGTLPEGLKVEYSDNKLTNAGELTAVASFVEYDEVNYNKPEDLTTTIKINKAILTATVQSVQVKPGVTPEYKIVFSGFVNNETEEVLDEEVVFVDNLNGDYSKPGTYAIGIEQMSDNNYEIKPVGGILTITEEDYVLEVIQGTLETTYNGKNQMFEVLVKQAGQTVTGKEIEYKLADGTEFTGATNAGKYEVTVSLKDGEAESLTVTFEIKKANYDLSKVEFKDITVEFDGKAHELVYNNIPEGLKVLVEGDTKLTNVGTAEATISFKNENENYNDVTTTVTATLTITKASLTKVEFDELPEVGFTGEAHEPKVNGKLGEYVLTENDYEITYDRNTDIGTAYVILNGKGNFEGEVQLTFVITESDLAKVRHAKEELEQQITELPETFVLETTNKSKVTWLSTSTALMINEDGTYKAILVENANEVVVYALVQYNNAVDYAKFTFTLPVIDTDTNIKIENVESNIQVKAEQLNDTTLANYTVEGENVVFGYDISLIKENASVQPDGKVTVRIPIPTEYLGNETLKVYHVTENGNVDMNAIPEDGYLVFETDSFSHYFVTIEKVEENPDEPGDTESEEIIFSDLNYDNQADVTTVNGQNFTMTFAKGANNNNGPKYYTSGTAIRVYYANTVTFTSNKKIIKIEFTFGSSDGKNGLMFNVGTYADGVLTITNGSNEIVVTIDVNENNEAKGNRRFAGVKVYYADGSSDNPEQPETPTEYTLTLNPDGGTLEQTEIKFTNCTEVNLPTNITKDGYTFLGWFEGTTKVEKLTDNRNYTLTAKWEESSTGGEEEPKYITIAEAKATAGTVTVRGVVTAKTAYSTNYGNFGALIEDATGGLYLYRVKGEDAYAKVIVGQEIEVTGAISTYKGLVELTDVTVDTITVVNENATLPTPGAMSNDESAQSKVVVLENAKWNGSAFEKDGTTYAYFYSADWLATAPSFEEGATYTVKGWVNWYNNAQITPIEAPTLVEAAPEQPEQPEEPEQPDNPVVGETKTESLNIFGTTGTLASDSLSISWEGENIKFLTEKAESTTAIRNSDSTHFRAYKGSKTTISCVNGEKITKVVITCQSGYVLSGEIEGATITTNGTVVTITVDGDGLEQIVIPGAAQWRLSKVEVTYISQDSSN